MNASAVIASLDSEPAVLWYAEALALVHHHRLQHGSDIVGHLRVTPAGWAAIDDAWMTALAAPGVLLAPGLVLTFASAFARARRRLATGDGAPSPSREQPANLRRPSTAVPNDRAPFVATPSPDLAALTTRTPTTDEDTVVPVTLASASALPFTPADARGPDFVHRRPPEPTQATASRAPDGHGTAVLGALIPGGAMPFWPASRAGERGGYTTTILPTCQ